jgi:hypothetical protein
MSSNQQNETTRPEFQSRYTLLDPIDFGTQRYTEVELFKPKVKMMKEINRIKDDYEKSVVLISKCSNLSLPEIDEMSPNDQESIMEILSPFLSKEFWREVI